MNEELMTMETTEDLTDVDVEVTYMEPEESGSGLGKVVGIGLAVLGAAGVAAWVKTKELRKNHQIKKLEKQGYVVLPASEVKEVVEVEEDFEEEASEEK